MATPRDILHEIERELAETRGRVVADADRLASLAELQALAVEASLRLGRPASVVDLFEAADDETAGKRLTELVRRLRTEQV